jgi:hypothetical protein
MKSRGGVTRIVHVRHEAVGLPPSVVAAGLTHEGFDTL